MTESSESGAEGASPPPPSAGGGLSASLQGLMATLLSIFQTRLDLLATEIELEKRRVLATMAWGVAAVLLGCLGLAFVAMYLTVLFWDSHRLLVLGLFALLFCIACGVAIWRVMALMRPTSMLEATLAELDADRQALAPVSAQTPQAASERAP